MMKMTSHKTFVQVWCCPLKNIRDRPYSIHFLEALSILDIFLALDMNADKNEYVTTLYFRGV